MTILIESEQFAPVGRQRVAKAAEELKLAPGIDLPSAIRLGRALGVRLLVTGTVGGVDLGDGAASAEIGLRLIDVETGEILYDGEASGAAQGNLGEEELIGGALRAAISGAVDGLIDRALR